MLYEFVETYRERPSSQRPESRSALGLGRPHPRPSSKTGCRFSSTNCPRPSGGNTLIRPFLTMRSVTAPRVTAGTCWPWASRSLKSSMTTAIFCQAITEVAVEQRTPITTEEFHILNRCLGDHAEERRLPELDRESLSQRLIEHWIAGRIGEIAEDDRVPAGQLRRPVEEHAAGGERHRGRDSADECPTESCRAEQPTTRLLHRVGSARQALQIGSQVGRVLISEIAIGLEASRDDSFQL